LNVLDFSKFDSQRLETVTDDKILSTDQIKEIILHHQHEVMSFDDYLNIFR